MASKEISSIHIMISKLTLTSLFDIMKKYHIDFEFHPRFPEPEDAIVDAQEWFIGVYRVFFKLGIRFSDFNFLKTILAYYHFHIAHITPNALRKIICFAMLCFSLDVMPFIAILCHFYVTMSNRD
ncbi:unnamed protein product [Lactuca virosa]|uniref:Transposase (putative) gypsy type domain-containing protein n=1 Tax=Lactuca virosa TaxID=75947 RepID=A0AAU9M5B1_9ASTR|nr:unnamed protein product [Lactuca virosa]